MPADVFQRYIIYNVMMIYMIHVVFTHANDSRRSKAFMCLSVHLSAW